MRHAANTVSAVFILNIRMLIQVSWPTMQTLVIYSTQQFDQDLHDLLSGNLYYKKIYFDNHVLIEKKDIYLYSVIALGLHVIIQYYHSYFSRTAHEIFISVFFFFFFTLNLFPFHSGHLITKKLSSKMVIQFR